MSQLLSRRESNQPAGSQRACSHASSLREVQTNDGPLVCWRLRTAPVAVSIIAFVLVLGGACNRAPRLWAQQDSHARENRAPWVDSRVVGSPEPPLPFVTSPAFPHLKFNRCIDIAPFPATTRQSPPRLFVLEQSGKLYSFVDDEKTNTLDLAVDLKSAVDGVRNTYAFAFHPEFAKNPYCYVCCIKTRNQKDGTQIIRFRVNDSNPPELDAESQTVMLTWPSGGHNGCCLKFGPDGFLYVSAGDGVGPNPPDPNGAGQDLSNLYSAILRIDVDAKSNGKNYAIPSDNPFVDRDNTRPEIWAYGFRNPWRMSFDQKTGDLWVGDVGWELWELLDNVEKGGNYGWSVMEGNQPTNTEFPRGPTPILPPTIEHPHSESSSITDGLTYYGEKNPSLHGCHIYGDYDTGKMWAFHWNSKNQSVEDHREIADTTHRIVAFGLDHQNEVIVLDHIGGTLSRITPNTATDKSNQFPRKLSRTGLFKDTPSQTPNDGVYPYTIAAHPWADHATADHWIAVPNHDTIQANKKWAYPTNTVLVKTLSLNIAKDAANLTKIETQLLHFDGENWNPYTYRWNESQTDAELVGRLGQEASFHVNVEDPAARNKTRQQTWRFAGRAECQRCHNNWSGPPLGFNAPMLSAAKESPFASLTSLGLINKPTTNKAPKAPLPAIVDPADPKNDIDARARSYLHVNCAHCHRKHAGGAVVAKLHHDVPLAEMNIVNERPSQGAFGIHNAQIVAPGNPWHSILLYRMSKLGGGRMPHIGSSEVDFQGVQLIREWIRQLPEEGGNSQPDTPHPNLDKSRIQAQTERLEKLAQAAQSKNSKDAIQQLLTTTAGGQALFEIVTNPKTHNSTKSDAINQATQPQVDSKVRELFEAFLPPNQRVQRLGAVVDANQVLKLEGDAIRGKALFFNNGTACKSCHRIGNQGTSLGPDLSKIGSKNTPRQLLESILEPSKRIDPKFVTHLVETDEGKAIAGLLIRQSKTELVLKTAKGADVVIPIDTIERHATQTVSLMPELQLQNMTAQQAADLVSFLAAQKE